MHIAADFFSLDDTAIPRGAAVTVGVFDGMHQGHQALVRRTVDLARVRGLTSLVVTFRDHPLRVLAPPFSPKRLLQPDRKSAILAVMGVDFLCEVPFTAEFSRIEPADFVTDILVRRCRMKLIVCGFDFTFGRSGAGNIDTLVHYGRQLGFEVEALPPVSDHDMHVKSTHIRDLLFAGEVDKAAKLLTRPHELAGIVVRGKQRGRTLGFPTANVELPADSAIPAKGVYLCLAQGPSDAAVYGAMVNIGTSPTFGQNPQTLEAHLMDFEGELAGQKLRLFFLRRLRDELKFGSADELVAQLKQDRLMSQVMLTEPEIKATEEQIKNGTRLKITA